jgi:hypothetical protein
MGTLSFLGLRCCRFAFLARGFKDRRIMLRYDGEGSWACESPKRVIALVSCLTASGHLAIIQTDSQEYLC